jgi:hypothetical protein
MYCTSVQKQRRRIFMGCGGSLAASHNSVQLSWVRIWQLTSHFYSGALFPMSGMAVRCVRVWQKKQDTRKKLVPKTHLYFSYSS